MLGLGLGLRIGEVVIDDRSSSDRTIGVVVIVTEVMSVPLSLCLCATAAIYIHIQLHDAQRS